MRSPRSSGRMVCSETGEWDAQTDCGFFASAVRLLGCASARDAMAFGVRKTRPMRSNVARKSLYADLTLAVDAFRSWQVGVAVFRFSGQIRRKRIHPGVGRGHGRGPMGLMGTPPYAYLPPQLGYLGNCKCSTIKTRLGRSMARPRGSTSRRYLCHEFGHLIGFDHDPSPGS